MSNIGVTISHILYNKYLDFLYTLRYSVFRKAVDMKYSNCTKEAKIVIQGLEKTYLKSASMVQLILSDAHKISLPLNEVKRLILEIQNG